MTLGDYEKGSALLEEICKHENRIKAIQQLAKRMEKITTPYTKYVKIQLAEQYIHTPQAAVRLDDFKDFLDKQIHKISEEIELLNKEFEGL